MLRGLYISTTNMKVNTSKIDIVSNNIANANTFGFKKDSAYQESFNDVLISRFEGSSLPAEGQFKGITSVKNEDGSYEAMTDVGYFRVMTDQGVSNNKMIKFFVDTDGVLKTGYYNDERIADPKKGYPVLGSNGKEIKINGENIELDEKGNVKVDGNIIDNIVSFPSINTIGTTSAGVRLKGLITDFSQGTLVPTESRLDYALDESGFFVVNTPNGLAYTRSGTFKLNEKFELITNEGYNVQGINGNIVLPSDRISTNEFGEIMVDGAIVDKLKVVNFSNKWDIEKIGVTLFVERENPVGQQIEYKGKVINGMIEQSNADSVNEMIRLMNLYREYESGQKIVKAYDDILNKACNEIARL